MSIYLLEYVIVCRYPSKISLNSERLLHCDRGAAVWWRDGYALYCMNGVRVSRDAATLPPEKIDLQFITESDNSAERKEIVRKVGLERVLSLPGVEVLDRWGNYELLGIDINRNVEVFDRVFNRIPLHAKYLMMLNPSVGTWHIEGVLPSVNTCREALAWRDGDEGGYERPEQLT